VYIEFHVSILISMKLAYNRQSFIKVRPIYRTSHRMYCYCDQMAHSVHRVHLLSFIAVRPIHGTWFHRFSDHMARRVHQLSRDCIENKVSI
jgi:hypothetical protein